MLHVIYVYVLTVLQEVWQRTILETIGNTTTTNNLLTDTSNHLGHVDL